MSANQELDLHTIAVLMDYERISGPVSDPRFQHTKLREKASPEGRFSTIRVGDEIWQGVPTNQPKHGFVLDCGVPSEEHDLPGNMLGPRSDQALSALREEELETIFHRIRGHDGCFQSIAILQAFVDLYDDENDIRIRLRDGTSFISTLSNRHILEYTLQSPKETTLSVTLPSTVPGNRTTSQTRLTGESASMVHAVWGFPRSDGGSEVVLDLASMQFGAVGRGASGHFFILQEKGEWEAFANQIARSRSAPKISMKVGGTGDPELERWFLQVAKRVKERWDARETAHFCGLCGKPDAKKRCARCKTEYYCSVAHSTAAWKNWHKKWCAPQ
ncbi:hypothetical protein DXG01_004093 [Tephrocybe rancida]|nr:hypothetical protein DXG01_004093 [Tephrocybe rancida]